MEALESYIAAHGWAAWASLIVAFVVLARCADLFVEAAVAVADRLGVPKLVIGIVLVSLATTAPELSVSLISALEGNPEMALGNAIGSVICDDGLALALAALLATAPVAIQPKTFRVSALFLIAVQALAFFFVFQDYSLERWEGAVLVACFVGYIVLLYRLHKRGDLREAPEAEAPPAIRQAPAWRLGILFVLGLGGIILASEFIVTSATAIALSMGIPKAVIALTLVAFGTSIPEVATCVVAARKGHGAVAVGNILGADIMNICWVAGASALANDLVLGKKEIFFMFPAMFVIVLAMLIMLRVGYRLSRWQGGVLLALYALYLVLTFVLFPPEAVEVLPTP